MIYLKSQHVIAFNTDLTGAANVRDIGLVESACWRPEATAFGAEAYPTIWEKAAALMQSLACNHPFIDGNKRTAWMAATVFLEINGHPLDDQLDVDEAEEFVLAVTQSIISDVASIASGLVKFCR